MRASASVMETEPFKTLAASMAKKMSKWKMDAKEAILAVTDLEMKATCSEIISLIATSSQELAKLFLLKLNAADNLKTTPSFVHYGFAKAAETPFIYIHPIEHASAGANIMVTCQDFLVELPLLLNATGPLAPSPLQKIMFNTIIVEYSTLLKVIFTNSWSSQIKVHQTLASKRAMTGKLKSFLDGTATQQAAMVIHEEPSVNPKVLCDLI